MPRDDVRRVRSADERARALGVWVVVTMLCFAAGLILSLRGFGFNISPGPAPDRGLVEPRTVDGVLTYVRVDDGGHAVACSSTYSTFSCSTVGVVISRRR
jgi:hypothetical protein